jgi:alanyl-tRNA synthetase
MGDFSTELCGGTHVSRTGDIGLFKIVSEAGVASGVRRIEAVTGSGALAYVADEERRLSELSQLLSSSGDDVTEKLRQLLDRQKKLERELESLRAKAAGSMTGDLASSAKDIGGIKVVAARLEGLDAKALRDGVDQLKQQLADCVIVLAGAAEGRVSLVAGVHGKAAGRIKAGEVVAHIAGQIEGKGGGRPDMAQGGGLDKPQLPDILAGTVGWIEKQLAD